MRILVTGGAGFIGSNYVRSLLDGVYPEQAGAQVVVLDKLTYAGNLANLAPVRGHERLTFVHGDIADRTLVDELMPGTDLVLNFAAETHVDRSILRATEFVTTNLVGTLTLLDAALAAGVGRFVQISTDEVYGSIETGSWDENDPLRPSSPYSASKAGADLMALAYHCTHGLDVVVTRSSNNYGPYQFPEKLIPLFVTNLLDGLSVPLYGDGLNVRDWLHVDDNCRAVQLVAQAGRPGQIYNIGGDVELTNLDLTARLLAACSADPSRVTAVTDRKGHDRRYSLAGDKIRSELGFVPQVIFADGLAKTVQWYGDHRDWWEPLKSRAAPA